MIPLAECRSRGVYRLVSRNLAVGVFNLEDNGFIGIREKFGERFLFTEYHHDNNSFGTARPITYLGMLPEEIELRERTEKFDEETGRPVDFDYRRKARAEQTGEGWGWYWLDTGKDDLKREIKAASRVYQPLLDFLEKAEERWAI